MIEACSGPGRGPWWVGKNAIPSCVRRAAPWPGSSTAYGNLYIASGGSRVPLQPPNRKIKTKQNAAGYAWMDVWLVDPSRRERAGDHCWKNVPSYSAVRLRCVRSPRISKNAYDRFSSFIGSFFCVHFPARSTCEERTVHGIDTSVGTIGRRAWRSSRFWWNDHSTLASLWDEGFFRYNNYIWEAKWRKCTNGSYDYLTTTLTILMRINAERDVKDQTVPIGDKRPKESWSIRDFRVE